MCIPTREDPDPLRSFGGVIAARDVGYDLRSIDMSYLTDRDDVFFHRGLPNGHEVMKMKRMRSGGAIPVLLMVLATVAPPTASAQDEVGARAAVERLFEGMRTADPDLVRSVLAADARFALLDQREGPRTVRTQPVDGWVGAIGTSGGSWNEQIYDLDVKVDGMMASIWAPYTFYLNGEISHCGINSIELLFDAGGWKITQNTDTRRADDCPDPHGA